MKDVSLIFLLFSFNYTLFSQEVGDYTLAPARDYVKKGAKNAAYVEFGGNAGLYSLNFDRIYLEKENFKICARIGFAPLPNGYHMEQAYLIENNFILFKNPHHLELGLGLTAERRYNQKLNLPGTYFWENILFSVWRCGYRFQKQDDGVFFRAALTPVIMSNNAEGFHPNFFQFWAGISLGVSF